MIRKQAWNIFWRWSLISIILIGGFWLIWGPITHHQVPMVHEIVLIDGSRFWSGVDFGADQILVVAEKMGMETFNQNGGVSIVVPLPHPISRWFDLLIGPLFFILVTLGIIAFDKFIDPKIDKWRQENFTSVIPALLVGLVLGSIFGLTLYSFDSLSTFLLFGIMILFIMSVFWPWPMKGIEGYSFRQSLVFSLFLAISTYLPISLVVGLPFMFLAWILAIPAVGLGTLISWLIYRAWFFLRLEDLRRIMIHWLSDCFSRARARLAPLRRVAVHFFSGH